MATQPAQDTLQPYNSSRRHGSSNEYARRTSADSNGYTQPAPQNLHGANGVMRTTSRRQQPNPDGAYELPAAPEAPQSTRDRPPLAYREPYEYEARNAPQQSSKSFAARATAIQSQIDSGAATQHNYPAVPAEATRTHARRRSEGQPIRATYATDTSQHPHSSPREVPSQRRANVVRTASGRDAERKYDRGPQPADIRPIVRSGTDWAADRSPLQRLEVKLNDISKEEKRARVQEAEQRLRERRASQGLDSKVARGDSRRAVSDARSSATADPRRVVSDARSRPDTEARRSVRDSREGPIQASRHSAGVDPSVRDALARRNLSGSSAETTRRSHIPVASPQAASFQDTTPRSSKEIRRTSLSNKPAEFGRPVRSSDTGRNEDRAVRFQSEDVQMEDIPVRSVQASRGPSKVVKDIQPAKESLGRTGSIQTEDNFTVAKRRNPVPAKTHNVHEHFGEESHLKHQLPPQTEAGRRARQQVGFGVDVDELAVAEKQGHHLPHLTHGDHQETVHSNAAAPQLEEWKQAGVARLALDDALAPPPLASPRVERDKAWWEKSASGRRRSALEAEVTLFDGSQENNSEPTMFNPPLYLKCGPLLRYTGIRRDRDSGGQTTRDTWRGSVMIVTNDKQSVYEPAPILRLFHQPMELLPPPPTHFDEDKNEYLSSEYVDMIGGLPKITRTGGTVWVKPVEDLEIGRDVSQIENDEGLFEATRTANVPSDYGRDAAPTKGKPGAPRSGRYREVKGIRLHAERGVTFWRFNLEVELNDEQTRVAYRINRGASVGFWVPGREQTMNVMFHSCNGFSMNVDSATFSGPDPLWRDVLNAHQLQPFHVMIGGGDQIYNDAVTKETKLFQHWLEEKNPHERHEADFSHEIQEELETFYLERYSKWFSQGLFGMANAQIPMVNIWDDHDIIDGFGSYPDSFMRSPVFCGLGNVAYKYYMLFQHQSVDAETEANEPSWVLGAGPGPYISTRSRSVYVSLGRRVAFLGLDCRTERTRDEVMSEHSYDVVLDRCRDEIVRGETRHLIVLLGIPIAYPRLVWLENVLTSRALDPIKALGRMGLLGGLMNKFDGGVEILDDLDDHWTARNHKHERNWFVEELQMLAAEKSIRVTILSGDVHLAAVGQFYSNKTFKLRKDHDFRYMPNIISSAIVNTPPPDMMADVLNRRNKVHHLNRDTDEDMIPMFTHDVDGKPRNNKRLLPKRNWCSITEYVPGSTPPPTPPSLSPSASQESLPSEEEEPEPKSPSAIRRTLSLGRGDSKPAKLIRRLSLGQRPRESEESLSPPPTRPGPRGENPAAFREPTSTSRVAAAALPTRPNFQRRPTTLEDAAKKGGTDEETGHINLEWGLDIKINCEVTKGDPSGLTESYRLLVPALFFADESAPPMRKPTLVRRLTDSMRAASYGEWARGEGGEGLEADGAAAGDHAARNGSLEVNGPLPIQTDGEPAQRRRSLFRLPQRTSSLLRKRRPESMPPATRAIEPFQPRPRAPLTPQQQHDAAPTTPTHASAEAPMSMPVPAPKPKEPPAINVYPRRPLPASGPAAYPAAPRQAPTDELAQAHGSHAPVQAARSRGGPAVADDDISDEDEEEESDEDEDEPYGDDDDDEDELEEQVAPRRRVASKFDATGASKFFGAGPVVPGSKGAQGPLYGDARDHGAARHGSYGKHAMSTNGSGHPGGNVRDSWASGDSRGYEGIEAYKEKKGWRRFLPT